jgi:hypothetical protein
MAAADYLFKNHNWIHPLVPVVPLTSVTWIYGISGFPDREKEMGFLKSTESWDAVCRCITVDEINTIPMRGGVLFVSVDLDFFYNKNYTPYDIPGVLDRLLDYSRQWNGSVVWALCVSRAWLPDDAYAWELLEQSLGWIAAQREFAPPELTLFSTYRYDTSRNAEAFRAEGREPPGMYQKESEMPAHLKDLFEKLMRAD